MVMSPCLTLIVLSLYMFSKGNHLACMYLYFVRFLLSASVPGRPVDPEHRHLRLPDDHGRHAVHRLHLQPLRHQH